MFMNLKVPSIAYGLITVIAIGWLIIIGSSIILPILYGILIALILNPLEKKLRKKVRFPSLSIIISFLIVLLPIILVLYVVSIQLGNIIDSLPDVNKNLNSLMSKATSAIYENIPFLQKNKEIIDPEQIQEHLDGPLNILQTGIVSSSQGIFSIALAILYSFFFLYYSKSFKAFIIHQFEKSSRPNIRETLSEIRLTVQSYIGGLGKVILILSCLNSIGLWLIGIDYALFWGILAGFLAVIPFIGTIIGGLLPFLYSLATSDYSWQPGAVAIYYFAIQQIEGNIITPKVIGNQVDLNPLFSIFALIFFGTIWGIGGIILSLPFMAVLKIAFDHNEQTKSLAVLMGSSIAEEAHTFKEIADG